MMRIVMVTFLLSTFGYAVIAQESDAVGAYVGQQIGVRGGQTVTLNLMQGGEATVAVAPSPGARPLISRGTWRFEGSGFIRVDIAGMAGSGTLYFHHYNNQLVATQDPFRLGGLPLQLVKQEPVPGSYTAVRSGESALQTLTLQLGPAGTATLATRQDRAVADWQGTWQTLPSGDVQITLLANQGKQQMTLTRDGGMLRASQWDHEAWGRIPLVFVKR